MSPAPGIPTPRRSGRIKWTARLLLAAGAAAALAVLGFRNAPRRISTDVLDLVPSSESAPELALIRGLAGDRESRVVLIALGAAAGSRNLPAARAAVLASLRDSGAFADVADMGGGDYRDGIGKAVFDRRFDLLGPGWLEARWREHEAEAPRASWSAWLAERTAGRLEAFLARPEAVGFQDLLPSDPLLLIPDLAEHLPGLAGPSLGASASGSGALVWGLARGDPFSQEGQAAVSAALDRAAHAAGASGVALRWTGVVRLAARSRQRIGTEVSRLNALSLIAVLLVAGACVRRPVRALWLAPVVLFSMLGAWAAVMAAFDRVHVLVFVVGSLLCGVAIDYGFYIFLQPPARPDEPYEEKAGRLLRSLLASSLTVVLGFSLLLASDLPLIRQVGVFVSAGLLAALVSSLLWFAQVKEPFLATRAFTLIRPRPDSRGFRIGARAILALAGAIALAGPWRLHWRDDIRDLQIPAPDLEANDRDLRARFGDDANQSVYITRGDDAARARAALDRFVQWNARQFPGTDVVSAGLLLPEPQDWAALPARLAGLDSFPGDFRAALVRHGFDPGGFEPFLSAWDRWRDRRPQPTYADLAGDFAAALTGPVALSMTVRPGSCWFATVAGHPDGAEPPAATATFSAHQLESLDRLFGRYRRSALRLSAVGLVLVGLSVFAIYGLRRGWAIFAVPCGSCLFTLGLFGLLGHPLNLFHLLGAFLGVCLAHNYAIFTWENAARGETPPPSIRLSALCTASSFGVLALSGIPVVSALGSTVAVIVLSALVAVELAPLAGRRSGLAPGASLR